MRRAMARTGQLQRLPELACATTSPRLRFFWVSKVIVEWEAWNKLFSGHVLVSRGMPWRISATESQVIGLASDRVWAYSPGRSK